ncbi:S41 family peptidase [Lichenicola sp.]|uniref:S41 family peptidase n=1 Tax=Lichenicola sp. TaxID=2804529 RepID=UPI003AFFA623
MRMTGRSAILLLCLALAWMLLPALPVRAQGEPASPAATLPPSPPATLDQTLVAGVIETALTVLQPRTLEPHTARQLTIWGLNGLTAIDPGLTVEDTASPSGDSPVAATPGTRTAVPAPVPAPGPVRLATPQGTLFSEAAPAADDSAGWARLAAGMTEAAWSSSSLIRQAGQQGVLQSFFDELCNHLDPYSRYVAPAPANTERAARSGGTASAGITLARFGRTMVVAAVNANGPAWSAGITVGGRLVAVDGHPVRGQTPEVVSSWLQGDPGSQVVVTIAPAEGRGQVNYPLVRAAVPPETVFAFSNGNIVVMRVTGFSADTAQEMSQFLDQATDDGSTVGSGGPGTKHHLRGLIFDLRGNRGGLLQQAVTSVALVLDHGIAVTARGRDPQANHVWAVQGGDLTEGVPIVVLVDGRTASAAEIMAAALADHRRAVIVGSATLGKGLVQTIAQLPDGGELFVTWSRVLAPLGWPLQGLGVIPQVCTSLGQAKLDQQLQDLAAGVFDEREAVVESRAARSPLPVARILELRAACPAAIGSDADLDAARSLLDMPGAYQAALVPVGIAGDVAAGGTLAGGGSARAEQDQGR